MLSIWSNIQWLIPSHQSNGRRRSHLSRSAPLLLSVKQSHLHNLYSLISSTASPQPQPQPVPFEATTPLRKLRMTKGMVVDTTPSVEFDLALNYLRYGLLVLVNNLWTLVALLTPALSFWRFNLLPSLARRRHSLLLKSSSSSVLFDVAADESMPPPPTVSRPIIDSDHSTSITPLPVAENVSSGSAVKGNRVYSRFSFNEDVIFHHREEDGEASIRPRIHEEDQATSLRSDVMKRLRLSDLGFYGYLDMRVLDGNVVKLWDNNASRSGGSLV